MKRLLALILALGLLLSFAGCKNEEKDEPQANKTYAEDETTKSDPPADEQETDPKHDSKLIGTWEMRENGGDGVVWRANLEFNKDGTYCMYQTDEQIREHIESNVANEFKTDEQLNTQLKLLGLKTKEDLIKKYEEDYVKFHNAHEKEYLYWSTQDGQILLYPTKADYDNNKNDKDMTKNYKLSEDGKVLTAGNAKLGNPDNYDNFDKVS